MNQVRVAVVDDSTFIRKAITRMLEGHPQIQLVGSAGSGEELLTNLERWRPDVVLEGMDCKIHDVSNLYVAGSSVFPTYGANFPTFTIVALALRLADQGHQCGDFVTTEARTDRRVDSQTVRHADSLRIGGWRLGILRF